MSSVFSCWWWWLLLGALFGWLLSWWFSRNTHRQTNSSWENRFADIEGRHAATLRQRDTSIARIQEEYELLKARPLPAAEIRIVEKIVDRPVDRIIEKIIDRPVDRVVERVVHVQVDNPKHLGLIRELEAEAASLIGLRAQIGTLQSAPPRIIERIVERPVDRIVERIMERIVERPVERIVEKVVNVQVDNPKHLGRIRELEAELSVRIESVERESRPVQLDKAAALAAGFKVRGMDDLEVIEGIGPKIAELLNVHGIHYFIELAQSSTERIQGILDRAGPNFRLARPDTWPKQAALAAANRWADLHRLHDELDAGNRN